MRQQLATPDRRIAQIAARQHGVVGFDQLIGAGLTPSGVLRRAQAGRLHRLYRGVYAVGHASLSREGRWLAAVLACGPQAVLSHESAAELWSLAPRSPRLTHVTVPGDAGRARRRGIVVHRSRTLVGDDATRRRGIPVTTPERTKRDLGWGAEQTRSHLERAFLHLLRAHGIDPPEVNARVGHYEVDFIWRARRLVVETDGWAYHGSRAAFESDRRRDRELQARGYVVLRFTYREVIGEPEALAAALRRSLRARRSSRRP